MLQLFTRLKIYKLGMFGIKEKGFNFWYGQVSSYEVDALKITITNWGKIQTKQQQTNTTWNPGK